MYIYDLTAVVYCLPLSLLIYLRSCLYVKYLQAESTLIGFPFWLNFELTRCLVGNLKKKRFVLTNEKRNPRFDFCGLNSCHVMSSRIASGGGGCLEIQHHELFMWSPSPNQRTNRRRGVMTGSPNPMHAFLDISRSTRLCKRHIMFLSVSLVVANFIRFFHQVLRRLTLLLHLNTLEISESTWLEQRLVDGFLNS